MGYEKLDRLVQRIKANETITKDKGVFCQVKENRDKILGFQELCLAKGLTEKRVIKHIYSLKVLSELFGKSFERCDKNDIIKVMSKIERSEKNYSEYTKKDFKVCLKVFFRWLRKTDDYPEEVRWLKESVRNNHQLPDILTEDDVGDMVKAGKNWRDQAFILGLYESGCRIQEYLDMKLKDVVFDEYSPVLIVNGKTGSRRIRIIDKEGVFKKWFEEHPFKDNPDAYVWVSLSSNATNKKFSYVHATKLIKNLGRIAGVKKKLYPHLLRHSRASHLANKLTESQLKQMFGWTQGSKMAATYVHLCGRAGDKPLVEMYNVMKYGEKRKKMEKVDNIMKELWETNSEFRKIVMSAVSNKLGSD